MSTTPDKPVRWGILGPGTIARTFRDGIADSKTGVLAAIATRSPKRSGLADDFPGARIHNGYQALLDDPDIDIVYIALPHPLHAEWGMKACKARKPVLCEKPLGLSTLEARAMLHAAGKAEVFMGEAYMYRQHPQTLRLLELVREGAIGEVRLIKSSFGFAVPEAAPGHRLFANELAGGAILDVGGYPVSMARLIAGAVADLSNGSKAGVGTATVSGAGLGAGDGGESRRLDGDEAFRNPVDVVGTAFLGATGVDEWSSAILRFDGGLIAEVSCSVSVPQDNMLRLFGTDGRIEVKDFWFAGGKAGGVGEIRIIANNGNCRVVEVPEPRHLFAFEVDAAAEAMQRGALEFAAPGMTWNDTLGNLQVMDQWRAAAGLTYGIETPERHDAILRGDWTNTDTSDL